MGVVEFDKELFQRIKKGDENALELLFKKYYSTLCLYVQTFVHLPELSEDIVTDMYTDIWLKRKQISIDHNVKSYLYTTSRNAALAYIRKKKLDTISLDDYYINNPDDADDPIEKLSQEQIQEQIQKILLEIPPRSRQVFILHRLEELKYKEVAEMLDISIKTVENHMAVAIKILNQKKDLIKKFIDFLILIFWI